MKVKLFYSVSGKTPLLDKSCSFCTQYMWYHFTSIVSSHLPFNKLKNLIVLNVLVPCVNTVWRSTAGLYGTSVNGNVEFNQPYDAYF